MLNEFLLKIGWYKWPNDYTFDRSILHVFWMENGQGLTVILYSACIPLFAILA